MKFQQIPWKHDPRSERFSHTAFFGSVVQLPPTLNRPRIPALNQQDTLRCTAYASAANGQYIHGIKMSPEWQTKQISILQGYSVDKSGGDPNAVMKSQTFTAGGYLPYTLSPVTLESDGLQSADPSRFNATLDYQAKQYGIAGYVKPDGGHDIFDSIRIALFMAYDPQTQQGACVQAFSGWYNSFSETYIRDTVDLLGYHSYLFVDWITKDGIDYLVMQNSYGNSYDNGYQYMPRSVVNREFSLPNRTLKILKPLTPEQIALAKQETPWGRIQRIIIDIWYKISIYLSS